MYIIAMKSDEAYEGNLHKKPGTILLHKPMALQKQRRRAGLATAFLPV